MREYIRLVNFLKPHSGLFIAAVICMVFSALFSGISLGMMVPIVDKVLTSNKIIVPAHLPPFLANLVDTINAMDRLQLLKFMAIAVVVLFFLKGLFEFLQGYLMSQIGQLVVRDIRFKLYEKLQSLSMDYFTKKRSGELISRITNDVKLVENAVSYGSTDLVYQSLQVIIFTFLVLYLYIKLAFVVLLLLPLISLPIVKVGTVLRKISHRTQEAMADLNSSLFETIVGIRIVKAFNMEESEVKKFSKINSLYYKLTMKSIKRMQLLGPFTELIGCFAGVLVFYWGGKDVIAGKLSFGIFGMFLGALFQLIRPFKKLSQVNAIYQQALAANTRIYDVLDSSPSVAQQPHPLTLTDFKESVFFENVSFSYEKHQILKDIHIKVKKGEILAIVGPSGAGKTTFVDLISRFYDPKKGRILLDGIDIREASFSSLRQQIGIVTQETILFNDTIEANIHYGNPGCSKEELEKAAMQAYAHEFIMRLPLGYSTVIGDRGAKLSGGERQRIAIARALLKNPPILILDEATSQLDSESERLVQEALNKLMQGRTVFVIAHRLSTIRHAHRIIVLEGGRIVEEGDHESLLARAGLYTRLYQNQQLMR